MHLASIVEGRDALCGAQDVGHERTAPGAEFNQADGGRRSHLLPDHNTPKPDQFAKDLAYFRCGGEVALLTKRVAGRVVAEFRVAEASFHIVSD